MFNSPILDLVILLSFTYFIGSLILSAINEAIAGALRLRPKGLKKSMEHLFFESGWKSYIRNNFINTPAMQSLMKRKGKYPAYISAVSFVQALICEINIKKYNPAELMDALDENTTFPKNFKQLLKNLWAQSQGDITVFEKKVEEFFNNAMDRATGWYKKKIRLMLLVLGFLLAFTLDIDSIKITTDALADKDKLSKAVDNISANLPRLDSLQSLVVTDTSIEVIRQTAQQNIDTARLEFKQTSGYGLGYDDFKKEWKGHFWLKILGLLITAFALQLGSNYWFDLINKAVNIRATGKRPDGKPNDDTKPKINNQLINDKK